MAHKFKGGVGIEVFGDLELVEFLEHLPYELRVKVVLKIAKEQAKTLITAARSLASEVSGKLAKTIGSWYSKMYKNTVIVGPRKGKRYREDNWYAHFVEYGTSGIKTRYTTRGKYNRLGGEYSSYSNYAGHSISGKRPVFKGGRYRAPQAPHPFMRNGWNSSKKQVANGILEGGKKVVDREFTNLKRKESRIVAALRAKSSRRGYR